MFHNQLPVGTIRYSWGLEFKDGTVGSMSEPSFTPLELRPIIQHYKPFSFCGCKIRVLKYVKTDKNTWFCDQNKPKGIRRIAL